MSDIFEMKGVNAELKVRDKCYRFADPKFKEKVLLQKEMKKLRAQESSMDPDDFSLAMYEITKKMVRQYLPELDDAMLEEMGDSSLSALMTQIQKLAEVNFGAVVEKVEKK